MSNPRPKLNAPIRVRTTPDTKFYIDYDWWEKSDLDIKTYLYTRLPIEDDANLDMERDVVDLVDTETGQVRQVDGFQYVVQTYFSRLPKDFLLQTSMVDAIFCALLANANKPMTAKELSEQVRKPINTVLKTLGGPRIYQGIRPLIEDD